jgi:predicted nucleic acid-binding protein
MVIFLDTNILWLAAHPKGGLDAQQLRVRMQARLARGDTIAVSEICDYEARRELLRKNATAQLRRLDALIATNTYVPLDTQTMRRAAQLWANLRNQGRLMASEKNLDGDVILAAQVQPLTDHLVVKI